MIETRCACASCRPLRWFWLLPRCAFPSQQPNPPQLLQPLLALPSQSTAPRAVKRGSQVPASRSFSLVPTDRLSAEELSCTTCDKVASSVSSAQLAAECAACCAQTERALERYARATLVFDKNYVKMFPEVDAFVSSKAQAQFRNLSVQVRCLPPPPSNHAAPRLMRSSQHSRGARPRLLMQDAHGDPAAPNQNRKSVLFHRPPRHDPHTPRSLCSAPVHARALKALHRGCVAHASRVTRAPGASVDVLGGR